MRSFHLLLVEKSVFVKASLCKSVEECNLSMSFDVDTSNDEYVSFPHLKQKHVKVYMCTTQLDILKEGRSVTFYVIKSSQHAPRSFQHYSSCSSSAPMPTQYS